MGSAAISHRRLQLHQQFHQGGEIHRLDHVSIEPGLSGLLPVFVLTPSGQRYHHHGLTPRLFAYSAGRFVAVQLRQADVEQHHVGPERRRRLHSLEAVVGRVRLVAGQFNSLARESAETRLSSTTRMRRAIVVVGSLTVGSGGDGFDVSIKIGRRTTNSLP